MYSGSSTRRVDFRRCEWIDVLGGFVEVSQCRWKSLSWFDTVTWSCGCVVRWTITLIEHFDAKHKLSDSFEERCGDDLQSVFCLLEVLVAFIFGLVTVLSTLLWIARFFSNPSSQIRSNQRMHVMALSKRSLTRYPTNLLTTSTLQRIAEWL